MRVRRIALPLALGAMLALAGCQGPVSALSLRAATKPSPAASGVPGAAAAGTRGAATRTTPGASTGATVSGSSGPAPARFSPKPAAAPGAPPAIFTAGLARQCVSPGGTQTLTIETTPGFLYAFDTDYGQGQFGSHFGGTGQGEIPPSGTFTSTWVVAAGVNPGEGTVYITVAGQGDNSQSGQLTFQVQQAC